MSVIDRRAWMLKTEQLNQGRSLKLGDRVVDVDGQLGVVVKIESGEDADSHGTIFVWQEYRTEYGSDNCEHYVEFGWQSFLRVIE